MLPETRGTSYARASGSVTVVVASTGELDGAASAQLLLDKQGHVVGLDLEVDTPRRLVVMLGPHEAVASTRDVSARVSARDRRISFPADGVTDGPSPYV